jgi:hypothetical protein
MKTLITIILLSISSITMAEDDFYQNFNRDMDQYRIEQQNGQILRNQQEMMQQQQYQQNMQNGYNMRHHQDNELSDEQREFRDSNPFLRQ